MAIKRKVRSEKKALRTKQRPGHSVKRICNLIPSKGTEQDWQFEHAVRSGALTLAALPPSVDLRHGWWKVGDQRNTGSCVGWATADGVVRYHMVMSKKLTKTEHLSARYVWMASKELDDSRAEPTSFIEVAGTSLKPAVDVCRKYGVITVDLLAFDIKTLMYTGGEKELFAKAARRKISAYFNLRKNLGKWKSWLASHGPILAGLSVDDTWAHASKTKGQLDKFFPNTVVGGHAATIVGYTTEGRFIIRNSWGRGWGDQGFAYASPAYIDAAFIDEAYGVMV